LSRRRSRRKEWTVVREQTPSLTELKAAVTGRLITPGDTDYDEARAVFYGHIDRRPEVIVRPANESDVRAAVAAAADTGLDLAVRSGGHSLAGHGVVDGGIVIDLADMKGLEVDADGRTAWAQTGLTAGEYTAAVGAHGVATGFGDTGSVGIGGITTGGGVGFLGRKYGLTVDQLLGAKVVTADGRLLDVDAENEPDLFWAIRGGGGNFGVATAFRYALHPVEEILGGMLVLPASADVVEGFVAAAEASPEELSTIAMVMKAPPMPFLPPEAHGKLVLVVMLAHASGGEEAERAVAPLRALADPLADMLRPMRYPEIYTLTEGGPRPVHEAARSLFVDGVEASAAATVVEHVEASTAPMAVAQLRVLGGAIDRVPNDATAYAHRGRRVMAALGAVWDDPDEGEAETHERWVTEFAEALGRGSQPGVYVNFVGDEGEARVREAYPGPTWDRLAAIKARYDPGNLFHMNQNIPPSA
jgi:FAD/FMN-containing dehydrogenase